MYKLVLTGCLGPTRKTPSAFVSAFKSRQVCQAQPNTVSTQRNSPDIYLISTLAECNSIYTTCFSEPICSMHCTHVPIKHVLYVKGLLCRPVHVAVKLCQHLIWYPSHNLPDILRARLNLLQSKDSNGHGDVYYSLFLDLFSFHYQYFHMASAK